MTEIAMPWRNRIVGSGEEAPDQLVANPENWRRHPGRQRDAIRGSLGTVGWVQQVLVNRTTGNVVDGHARVEEALSAGAPMVPVLYVELTPDEERQVLATLDPITGMADVDGAKLAELLGVLTVDEPGLAGLLADLGELSGRKEGLVEPDEPVEPRADPGIERGELWELGEHRVYCGDATAPADVRALIGDAPIDLVWTDPPFGVDYIGKTEEALTIQGDERSVIATRSLIGDALRLCPLKPGGVFYIAAPLGPTALAFLQALDDAGWDLHQSIIWVKNKIVLGRSDFHYQHEGVLTGVVGSIDRVAEAIAYGWKPGAPHLYAGDRRQSTVWDIPRPGASRQHPTMKPVELVARSLEFSSSRGDRVYDPFAGSGTTLIACEQLGRRGLAMEIDPQYARVVIDRWEQFTGATARLVDGVAV